MKKKKEKRRNTDQGLDETTAFVTESVDEFGDLEGTATEAKEVADGDVDGEEGASPSSPSETVDEHRTAKVEADVLVQLVGEVDKVEEGCDIVGDVHVGPVCVLDVVHDLRVVKVLCVHDHLGRR